MKPKSSPTVKVQATTILGILVLLFAVPLILACGLYYGKIHWHWDKINKGYLLSNVIQLNDTNVKLINGVAGESVNLSHKWNILYLNTAELAPAQLMVLDKISRVRLALGKDFSRVKQSYGFIYDDVGSNINEVVAKQFKQTSQLAMDKNSVDALLRQLPVFKPLHDAIFIVDPRGHVILGYKVNVAPDDICKDLERLLQYT